MIVLGIEGTAWCASAAVYDAEADDVFIESDAYEPESGGIHPREAAEHMSDAIPAVIDAALSHAEAAYGRDSVDVVAFSRGPGLGPCLRTVGTAARALAGTLDVPLVGVNHMVAHLEIGRHRSGFDAPICLNASGANAHLLGYHDGRYRVLGETMDTGVGNAIDKFTRHVGWTHPGGPKVEAAAARAAGTADIHVSTDAADADATTDAVTDTEADDTATDADTDVTATATDADTDVTATDADTATTITAAADADTAAGPEDLVELPYVVKGMDFSFSGIMSAAKDAVDAGEPVDDVCFALQEHIFAMLTEVAERALSLTGAEELVLGGGVGQNDRLREMLATMCRERGAAFYAPEPRFLRDNAGMIAVLGAKMAAANDTVAIADSAIDPDFRPDQVPVTWRDAGSVLRRSEPTLRGAEAVVEIDGPDRVVKRRVAKAYRHPALDATLRRERTTLEARLTSEARRAGVPTPLVHDVDLATATLTLQYVGDADLAADPTETCVRDVGAHLARLHGAGIVHGDPTTRNVRVGKERTFLIDFGLGYHSGHVEDHAMDLHVFEQSVRGTVTDPESLVAALEGGYAAVGDPEVLDRLRTVEGRGRYQ